MGTLKLWMNLQGGRPSPLAFGSLGIVAFSCGTRLHECSESFEGQGPLLGRPTPAFLSLVHREAGSVSDGASVKIEGLQASSSSQSLNGVDASRGGNVFSSVSETPLLIKMSCQLLLRPYKLTSALSISGSFCVRNPYKSPSVREYLKWQTSE